MSHRPDDDQKGDKEGDNVLLRRLLADRGERDPGFTWRVLTALPPRRPQRRFRLILLLATAVAGGLLSFFVLGGASALTGALPAAGHPSSLFLTGVVLLALAAAVLGVASEAGD
jgi:hypothetical protein